MAEELFELRNYFYLGNYATAITEGETVSLDDPATVLERDVILARIRLAQGHHKELLSSIADDAAPALQVVKLLARLQADRSSAEDVAAHLAALTALDSADGAAGAAVEATASPGFIALAAIAYAELGDFDNALRIAHLRPTAANASGADLRGPGGLEARAVSVQVLLQMDRVDVAEKEVTAMQSIDEDATLTQLAAAWVHLAKTTAPSSSTGGGSGNTRSESGGDGGDGEGAAQEALYIFQDLLERHGATDAILNGMAVCHLSMGKADESERVLNEALAKNQNCSASLVNVICTAKYRNKPAELVARYFSQLEKVDGSNAWLVDYRAKEAEFEQLAEQLVAA